ncbi:unnamed protein product [Phytomonas sp. EM1]|nr:unnamed protein product [Phytomonas sp. EM1]|eukprot:CCW65512.1 unnamed protein product [Phytomonas sp. isolate EM1]
MCCSGVCALVKWLFYYGLIISCIGILVCCVIKYDKLRYLAIILLLLVILFIMNIWRCFPCERRLIKHRARIILVKSSPYLDEITV